MDKDTIMVYVPENVANQQLPDEELLAFYQDLEHRVLWIDDEISELSLLYVKNILRWNREDDLANIPIEQRVPIRLLFHSVGGDLDIQAMMSNIITLSRTPVIGIAMGMVESAAAYIFLNCHKRYMLPSSYFLFHKGSIGVNGNANDVLSLIEDYQAQLDMLIKKIVSSTDFTEKEVMDNIGMDWYVRAPLALEKKVVDKVIDNISDLY